MGDAVNPQKGIQSIWAYFPPCRGEHKTFSLHFLKASQLWTYLLKITLISSISTQISCDSPFTRQKYGSGQMCPTTFIQLHYDEFSSVVEPKLFDSAPARLSKSSGSGSDNCFVTTFYHRFHRKSGFFMFFIILIHTLDPIQYEFLFLLLKLTRSRGRNLIFRLRPKVSASCGSGSTTLEFRNYKQVRMVSLYKERNRSVLFMYWEISKRKLLFIHLYRIKKLYIYTVQYNL